MNITGDILTFFAKVTTNPTITNNSIISMMPNALLSMVNIWSSETHGMHVALLECCQCVIPATSSQSKLDINGKGFGRSCVMHNS